MKTGYLRIENSGEIDIQAFRLLGASSKRDDSSKIGFFGSGLKYAMAVLLREDVPFKIFSGEKEIEISTKKTKMRNTWFDVIHVDGVPTSLTTDMGPSWEPWFAIREIYCNAIDEGSHLIGLSDKAISQKGKTTFYVEIGPKTQTVLDKWDKYFAEKRTDLVYKGNGVRFYAGDPGGLILYRKGIQCYTSTAFSSLYHYDCDELEINESRVIESDYELKREVADYFAKNATVEMIRNFMEHNIGTFEHHFYWDYVFPNFSMKWLEAIDGRHLVPYEYSGSFSDELSGLKYYIVPNKLIEALKKRFPGKIKVVGQLTNDGEMIKEPDKKQQVYVDQAIQFLKSADIHVDHKILICDFDNKIVLGRARSGLIYLSPKLFELGMKQIVSVLLEEYSHLETGYEDKSRGMQSYLFNRIVTLLEEKTGKML